MRKFYKVADVAEASGGFAVRLDGKPVRTPLGNSLLLPSKPLAEAVALEWAGQGREIKPASMPLTQLANTMIDKAVGADRAEMEKHLLGYGGADLICYFASHPATLVKRQQAQWLPLLAWMKDRHGVDFQAVSGIRYSQQPQASIDKLKKLINGLSPADFTVVQAVTGGVGSVTVALALLEGRLTPEQAYQAACVDEIYQLDTWGEDNEARKRLNLIRSELESIARFRDLAGV